MHRRGVITLSYKTLKRVKDTLRVHHSKDGVFLRRITQEMAALEETYPWKCSYCGRLNKKTHTTCPQPHCQAHWSTGVRHNTEPRGKETAYKTDTWDVWNPWQTPGQQWDDNSAWNWKSTPSTPRQRTQSPRARKGKGKDAKNKEGKGKVGGDVATASPFGILAPSMPPWPTAESPGPTPFATSSAAASTPAHSVQDVIAMAAALREAYPDEKSRPESVNILIEKAERETAKDVAKGIHAATSALSRAQKVLRENIEARRQHKAQWAKHVGEAIQTWQKQLSEFRKQQTSFQEISNKAKSDIDLARSTIQELNAKAANTGIAGQPIPTAVEAEEAMSDLDKEEEKLKQDMQNVLQKCAQSLGLDLSTLKEVQEVPSEEDEGPANKRPRSMEPFGGSVMQS